MYYFARNCYCYSGRNLLPKVLSLSDFSDIRFKTGENASEYYQKKMHAGRALRPDTILILEDLIDGLPRELKQLVIVNSLKSTAKLQELVHRLNKFKIVDNTQNKTYRLYPVNYDNSNPNYFRQ